MPHLELIPKKFIDYEIIGPEQAQYCCYFAHGIMGNKKNLKSFAQALQKQLPDWKFILFDLRNHGLSSKGMEPFTVEACASDLVAASKALPPPNALVGHSFGGKVVLLAADKISQCQSVWVLDCAPGIKNPKPLAKQHSFLVSDIISALKKVSWPVSSRKDLVEKLLALGVTQNIALWMTTNLQNKSDGLYLVFEPSEIANMLNSFLKTDLWPLIERNKNNWRLHLVAAEYGDRLDQSDREKLSKINDENFYFHTLEKAGHFLHSDQPLGLIELMKPFFSPTYD